MREIQGNIWDHRTGLAWVVVTTNIGWKKDGMNPMGAGIAKQAQERFPELPLWYGNLCQQFQERLPVVPYLQERLFLFPTKPFNPAKPWLSWQNRSTLELVLKSTKELVHSVQRLQASQKLLGNVYMPLPGCGNGGLAAHQVLPMLRQYLIDDCYQVVIE